MLKNSKIIFLVSIFFVLIPVFVYAAPVSIVGGLPTLGPAVSALLNYLFRIILVLSVAVVVWGGVQIMTSGGDEELRKSGRAKVLGGMVGVFAMLTAWALVVVLIHTFQLDKTVPFDPRNYLGGIH